MYDLLIQNGRIIDGTGSAAYQADIGVVGDEIAAIGRPASSTCTPVETRPSCSTTSRAATQHKR